MDQDLWSEEDKFKDNENVELIKPFTEDEIKTALFQMEKNKVVGPDGFPIDLFHKNCNVVKMI
jgi:hypothetical protein